MGSARATLTAMTKPTPAAEPQVSTYPPLLENVRPDRRAFVPEGEMLNRHRCWGDIAEICSPRDVRRGVTNAALLPPRTAVRVGGAAIAAFVAVLVTAAGAALRAVVALAKSTLLKLKTA